MKIIANQEEIKDEVKKAIEQHINLIVSEVMKRLKKIEDREKIESV